MNVQQPRSEGNSNAPSGPLTRGERCRLIEEAGLSGCHLDRLASVTGHGWTGVKVYLALLDYASITGAGCYANYGTIADRADTNKRYVEAILPALEKAGLAHKQQPWGEKAIWWPLHPEDGALLPRGVSLPVSGVENPSGPRDRQVSRDPAERDDSGDENAVSRDLADVPKDPTTDDYKQLDDGLPPERSSACEEDLDPGGDGSDDRERDQAPVTGRETRDEKSGEEELPDGAEEAPEPVSPEPLGYHRGDALLAGRSEYGPYLLWENEELVRWTGSKFVDEPAALEMDLDAAARAADEAVEVAAFRKLCEATVLLGMEGLEEEYRAELEEAAADAPAVVEALRPPRPEPADPADYGSTAEWLVATGVIDEVPREPPAPSATERAVEALREVGAHFCPTLRQELDVWLQGGPTEDEMLDLYDGLLHRLVVADEQGEEPEVEHLAEVLAEVAA